MAEFHLQIVTPDKTCYDGMAEKVICRTVTGDVCILARHIDYTAPLAVGMTVVTNAAGEKRKAACNSGLLSVLHGEVKIIATTFEWADEIDKERAEAARLKAEEALKALQADDINYAVTEAKLKRAVIRMMAKE